MIERNVVSVLPNHPKDQSEDGVQVLHLLMRRRPGAEPLEKLVVS